MRSLSRATGLLLLVATMALAKENKAKVDKAKDDKAKDEVKIEEENGVLVLTQKNFKKAIEDNEAILVEFYAPWCGHCKSLAPEYEKAAQTLSKAGSAVKLAKVDATIEKELGDEYKVQGFPTLKFFKNGKPKEYNGPREAKGIVSWLEKKTGPVAKDLKTVDEAKTLTDEKEVVLIGFFKDQKSADAKEFIKAAEDNDDQTFAITSATEVWKKYDVKKDAIVLLKQFDEGRNDYEGKITATEVNKFARANAIPLINEFSQDTAPKIFGSDVKVHLLLLSSKEHKDHDKMIDAIKPAAKENKGKMVFVHVDSEKADNAQVLEFFGMKKENCPSYIVFEMEKSAKYLSGKTKVEAKEVSKFVQDYFAGKLTRTLKSEDLPKDWDKEPVKVLVSTNFKKVAMDKTKDVFVEFYAPWCGHCKSLAPIWDQLGEKFKDHESIVIAKMDSTANEVEEVSVEGFPTLKLFKKDSNEIVDYGGKRELKNLITFLETGDQGSKDSAGAEDEDDDDSDDEEEEDDDKLRDEL